MYRIRFHGRGGQGMKTASRILGTAFFHAGFEVQDAPRYGAERRGAPMFAYVRAARQTINERGIIRHPDLVIVADDTLMGTPTAAVQQGITGQTVMLIHSSEQAQVWRSRLNLAGPVFILPAFEAARDRLELRYIGTACAAAAARLIGVFSWSSLEKALREELAGLGESVVEKNLPHAQQAYDLMESHQGTVTPGAAVTAESFTQPKWIDLSFESARRAAPAIHAAGTSEQMKTGLWRTMRPIIDRAHCKHCWWVCSTFCPDGVIQVDAAGCPQIDYAHCKGCMVCVSQCPNHAIEVVSEQAAQLAEKAGESK
ncbi:MAG: 2-oxoacid:acceptor oxidoreductase family protein [Deltaproteobacteria bacterium]|nr:2-oxoacid:acceptor oxidoreductase family protein [Deltaproteobacteria bacterium]